MPQTVDSLIAELSRPPAGISFQYTRISDDALISRSRSRAASKFLARTRNDISDVLVMVDHDLQWRPGDLVALARKAHERQAIVGGMYACRGIGVGHSSRLKEPDAFFTPGGEKLHPAELIATGFMAIPRDVLKLMVKELDIGRELEQEESLPSELRLRLCVETETSVFWDFFRCITSDSRIYPGKTEFLSEDWSFTRRAEAAGVPLFVYERPVLIHHGMHGFEVKDG